MKKNSTFHLFFLFKLLKNLKKNAIIVRYNIYVEKEAKILGKQNQKKVKNKESKRESLLVTKESLCATFATFSFLAILIACTGPYIFGDLGLSMFSFFAGIFGYLTYPLLLGMIYLSVTGLLGKRLVKNRRAAISIALGLVCIALIVHTALTFRWLEGENYLAMCLSASDTFPNATVAGWLGGLIVFAVSTVMSNIGTIVLFSLFTLFFGYLTYLNIKHPVEVKNPVEANVKLEKKPKIVDVEVKPVEQSQPSQVATPQFGQNYYEGYSPISPISQPYARTTPKVSINETTTEDSNVYSPFGRMEEMQHQAEQPRQPQTSHEILFGGDQIENFTKNGMFDPNSKANNRSMELLGSMNSPTNHTFVPSYTNAYEEDLNQDTPSYRPATPVAPIEEPTYDEPMEQLPYLDETPSYQEPTYPTMETPSFEQSISLEEPRVAEPVREEYLDLGRDSALEPPIEEPEERSYRGSEFLNIFSNENPRLLEEMGDTPTRDNGLTVRGFGEEEPSMPRERGEMSFGRDEIVDRGEERGRLGANIFDEPETNPYSLDTRMEKPKEEEFDVSERGSNNTPASYLGLTDRDSGRGFDRVNSVIPEPPKEPEQPKKPRVIRPYKRVSLDDFDCRDIEPSQNSEEVEEIKANIIATLEEFKVMGATIASVTFGPTVTRYNVALPRSVSPRKILSLEQSIAISLHSSGVSIYPNYDDGVVSIEVPNKERQFVQLGCMLSGNTFVNSPAGSLMFAMGKNVANAKVYGDISKMIHLLVAGSSGSGKSVFLGALIVSMIYKYSPEELRLILIDPKKTEFVLYNNLPHLMINEIITDVNKAVQSLNWAIGEMNRRYTLFEQMSRAGKYVVNLDQYNEQLEKNERLPKIVIIIDELADLMLAAKKDIEDKIQNLTQKARAAGIHLIVATQRPSADVITGVIKSNLSTRIAFAVASDVDSRVILDQSGAQKLLGKGDFLYSMPGINTPVRVQSAFISPADSQKVVNYIKENNEAYYDEEATAYINNTRTGGDESTAADSGNFDPMCIDALRYVILSGSASISLIQRKCSVGFNRAGNIIEWMEEHHYISPFEGAKARKVLITKEQFESEFGPL